MKRQVISYRVVTTLPNNKKVIVFKGNISQCNNYVKSKGINSSFYKIERAN